ncbi:MAG TPA: hypothetical protein VGC42_30590 [Kofleriaceae bacterium]
MPGHVLASGAALAWAGACGGAPPAPPPSQVAVIPTPRLTADDAEVARVNGHPIWASCVAAQARTLSVARTGAGDDAATRKAALDQCVAFELLAQAAEARGLGASAEVGEAVRGAAANRLVELDFERRYRTPADLKPAIDAVMPRVAWRMHIIQLRASAYARFAVGKQAPPEVQARARQLAEQLAGQLAGQTGLFPVHLIEAAQRLDQGTGIVLESAEVKAKWKGDLVDAYADALYAIPEVGQIAPRPVRTDWGWDVVMWSGGVEPKESTRDELAAEMFPELRRRQFQLWTTQLIKQLGLHVELVQDNLARLDEDTGGGEPAGGAK